MTKLRVPFPTFVVANFVGITCDEVNKVDNGSWISIHAYIVRNWFCIHHLISLQRDIDGFRLDYLTLVIMDALTRATNMDRPGLANAFLCFGVDSVSTF